MISELKIRNFKSLENVDLKLGNFNLLVGANASGKSNFLDALRFLQGIGNGFTIDEILDGKPPSATSLKWDGIRGGSTLAAFRRKGGMPASKVEFEVSFGPASYLGVNKSGLRYHTDFSLANPISWSERFITPPQLWYEDSNTARLRTNAFAGPFRSLRYEAPVGAFLKYVAVDPDASAIEVETQTISNPLTNGRSLTDQSALIGMIFLLLADVQFLDPNAAICKGYSKADYFSRLGENGEGLAGLIEEITKRPNDSLAFLAWIKELRPDEIESVIAVKGADNDFMLAVHEGKTEFRAPVLSDGTLRFIALAAAFFQPFMPKILVIEEIEKGLHPSRLRLLVELMRPQSKRTGTQVFATTHSPTVLAWLNEEDRKTTFVCTRDDESGATKMRSLAEVPRLEELIGKDYQLDRLFEEGWLESVLHES